MPDEPTYRELFNQIMHYGEFDRMPVVHWTTWPETHQEWLEQGLPEDVSENEYLDADPMWSGVPINVGLYPQFEEEVIEETDEYRIFRQGDGVIAQDWKNKSCIPHFVDFTMTDRSGWDEYKKRLQPSEDRIPDDLDAKLANLRESEVPVCINCASMVGWTRNWMGVENLAYACFDDRDLLAEIADTIADLVCWAIDRVAGKVQIDVGLGWEDICFKSGPLVSPDVFSDCCVPAYSKVSTKLQEVGCDLYVVDCDGKIDDLAPLWLEGGVNIMFPIEIGTWQADPESFRDEYGQELRIYGGIDKRELTKGRDAIDAEIERRKPLMARGGFIPLPDHLIIPGTPMDDYRYYLDRIRELRF